MKVKQKGKRIQEYEAGEESSEEMEMGGGERER